MKISRRRVVMGLATGALTLPALAQTDTYPIKPIRVIVPFAPGGGGDNQARLILTRVSQELGQPFVFDNIAGAGGNLGCQQAARAAADGYTLLYGTNGTHGINHALYKSPGFNPKKDFQAIGRLSSLAAMLVVRPGLPANNVSDLVKLLRAKPGAYSFGSAGYGTTSHLTGEMFKAQEGLFAIHVPYRGGAPALIDLMGGRLDFMIDVAANTAPQVQGGRLKALAVTSAQRLSNFPELPTMIEAGLPGFQVTAWDALFAPAGTPAAIVDKVNAAIRKALADPELRKQMTARGVEAYPSSAAELTQFVSTEMDKWGAAVKRSGATID
jgi:tripartite-type tricarboxylate transporter receptor subunit TctC